MTTFIQDYYLFFMVVLLSLSILILLRSLLGLVGQVIYFAVAVFIILSNIVCLVNVLFVIYIIFSLLLIYRIKAAIDYDTQLHLELTHLTVRYYTKTDYTGTKNSFLK